MTKRILCVILAGMFGCSLIATVGCSNRGGQAEKLEAPDDIDWEAIEAEGSEMADSQQVGE